MRGSRRERVLAMALLAAGTMPTPVARVAAEPSPFASPASMTRASPASSTRAPSASTTRALSASTTRAWSERGRFDVSWVSSPSPVPLFAIHSWTVTVRDANDRPVEDASVTVLGGMPAHAHGLPTVPEVRSLGAGRYLVEGLKFHMPGTWVVAFRIKRGTVTDTARFELEL